MQPATNKELLTIFERIDRDNSGTIEVGELREALKRKGVTENEATVRFNNSYFFVFVSYNCTLIIYFYYFLIKSARFGLLLAMPSSTIEYATM